MGASWQTLTYPGNLSRVELAKRFKRDQDDDRRAHGTSLYSGSIGCVPAGLQFSDREFDKVIEASTWLSERCEKWEPAVVAFVRGNPRLDIEPIWLVGAWCPE